MLKKKEKFAIALSGGIDSAAAALLLKNKGYDLAALYLKLFEHDRGENQAQVIAEFLNMPFYAIDAKKEFRKKIIEYFLSEYKNGRTPNPCVRCNRDIKFGLLYEKAMGMGFEKLATGHYISIKQENNLPAPRLRGQEAGKTTKQREQKLEIRKPVLSLSKDWKLGSCGEIRYEAEYHLYISKDKGKDQSYFLYNLTQDILRNVEFPLGNYRKEDIKASAKKWRLPAAENESQDICFLAGRGLFADSYADYSRKVDHNEFLKEHLKMKKGDILLREKLNISPEKGSDPFERGQTPRMGKKIGEHQGLPLYTIGQRRAVGVGGIGPYYVVEKDEKRNILTVSEDRDDPLLYKDKLFAEDVNWISGREPKMPLKAKVKIRYRHEAVDAVISTKQKSKKAKKQMESKVGIVGEYIVKFKSPQRAVTPGQSVVFYKNSELIGGGVISTKQ
ncbi:hypothetical protein A2Y83_04040 [Candidatus Falkowbacteria bacterium RBG_13_39_14]|uniref:tRNA-specific 2-thiouridylase MnmA n=1 Tax=Candidatus Falkowbacteria bacterium RBG_13_39_14 TaxID=1797985 RepID=A0A1F5S7F6_9BACT|nr:MAG: hypothetical protein A2Y83_04040 [Candidatus Falkowbacteria bacterium RBG_13_39_14]